MKIRTASLLAAVALGGVAVAAYAQGVFDPGPVPPLPETYEESDGEWDEDAENADEALAEAPTDEIVYEAYEVVQPIDDTPGPAARTIEPPESVAEEWVEAEAPARRGKLVKLERVAAPPARDKRVRIIK